MPAVRGSKAGNLGATMNVHLARVRLLRGRARSKLVWWPPTTSPRPVSALLAGQESSDADALANGVPLRPKGLLGDGRRISAEYRPELAMPGSRTRPLTWGGYAPQRRNAHDHAFRREARARERMVDDAHACLQIRLRASNRVWPPTTKRRGRPGEGTDGEASALPERIEGEGRSPSQDFVPGAGRVTRSLQLETVELDPTARNVRRARVGLAGCSRCCERRASSRIGEGKSRAGPVISVEGSQSAWKARGGEGSLALDSRGRVLLR